MSFLPTALIPNLHTIMNTYFEHSQNLGVIKARRSELRARLWEHNLRAIEKTSYVTLTLVPVMTIILFVLLGIAPLSMEWKYSGGAVIIHMGLQRCLKALSDLFFPNTALATVYLYKDMKEFGDNYNGTTNHPQH